MSLEVTKVKDLVAERPGLVRLFERLGIDYCCGGRRTLADACASAGLELEKVVAEMDKDEAWVEITGNGPNWRAKPLSLLIAHIVDKHHAFVKAELPRLEGLIGKVCAAHGVRRPELLRIQRFFSDLKEELGQHLLKEERILFPYIVCLEDAARKNQPAPPASFGTVRNPIQMMALEHDHAGEALLAISAASSNYSVPAEGCASYRALYQGLQAFEQDLHQHIHLENNILFPRAVEMEEDLQGVTQSLN